MIAHWPQFLVMGWLALRFATACQRSGQKIERTFKPTFALFDAMLVMGVLYAGGFFASLGWSTL